MRGAGIPAPVIKGGKTLADNVTNFVAKLNAKIEESDMTNTEIAKACGVDISHITHIRKGRKKPGAELLLTLIALFKIKL